MSQSIKIDGKELYGTLKYDDLYYEACRAFNEDDPYLDAQSFYNLHPAVVFNLEGANIRQYITVSSKNTGYTDLSKFYTSVNGYVAKEPKNTKRLFVVAPVVLQIKNGSVYDIK